MDQAVNKLTDKGRGSRFFFNTRKKMGRVYIKKKDLRNTLNIFMIFKNSYATATFKQMLLNTFIDTVGGFYKKSRYLF